MNIELFLDTNRLRKNGFPITISIFNSQSDKCYPTTNLYAFAEDWDFEKLEPKKSHPQYSLIISKILEYKIKIHKVKKSNFKRTAVQAKNYIFGQDGDIYAFWEQRIKEEEKKLLNKNKAIRTKGNAGFYETTLNVWKNYKPYLSYEEITYDFIVRFKIEKSSTCGPSGINTYLKAIRAIYNEAIRRGLYTREGNYPFEKVMEKELPTRDKYLTIEEMQLLISKPSSHVYYKYFLLCFYLGGLDFIDLASLKKSDIRQGRVKKVRSKGNTREVINNRIFPEAQRILDFFTDEESEYLLPIYKYNYTDYRKNYASRIKPLFSNIGITSHVDSKSPRYSFIHIGSMELYQNRDIIKELVGHAQGDTLSIYEGKFPEKIKDEVHRKIIDAVIVQEKQFPADSEFTDIA